MFEDKMKWNEKYLKMSFSKEEPSEIVKKYYNLAKIGTALDIACGLGRNSKFLAQIGYFVDAVDISDIALKNLQNIENINPIEADLDSYKIKEDYYDLIVCINYLNRNLFPQIREGLKNSGLIIYETFVYSKDNENEMKKEYLLEKNELLHQFIDFDIIYYEEKMVLNEKNQIVLKAYLVARKKICR